VGHSSDGETDLGPLISAGQLKSVEQYIKLGIEEGATPALLGKRPDDPDLQSGHFITPTIFTDVDNSMRIAQEEIFGPVLCVIKYDGEEDAIRMANDTIYGLAAGVWSRDVEHALSVAKRIRAGTVWINDYHLINAEAPFGGYKQSGIGRELGEWGLKEYTGGQAHSRAAQQRAAANSGSTSWCRRKGLNLDSRLGDWRCDALRPVTSQAKGVTHDANL
jgi:acyl-CoA reductase-like NAD-dependent aldehyde dehydrogenase